MPKLQLSKLSNIFSLLSLGLLVFSFLLSPQALALSRPAQPVIVTPFSAANSLANPMYKLQVTVVGAEFDWTQKMNDHRAGIANSNPYTPLGTAFTNEFSNDTKRTIGKDSNGQVVSVNYTYTGIEVKKPYYKDFDIAPPAFKDAFGDIPVLGITPNQGQAAQSLNGYNPDGSLVASGSNIDRSKPAAMTDIFDSSQLSKLCSTTNGNCNNKLPRVINTSNLKMADGVWQGGMCVARDGKMIPRMSGDDLIGPVNGYYFDVTDYNLDPNTPITTCAWENKAGQDHLYDNGIVYDQPLSVYQFIWKVPFPQNKAECDADFWELNKKDEKVNIFPSYDACISWFRNNLAKPLAGADKAANADALYYTYTYYGAFDDVASQFVGYTNPDVAGPRASFSTTASLEQLRNYYGTPNASLAELQSSYNGFIRAFDAYSAYAI